ncbi:hypothetical protein CEXT_191871 [Caerostris extrusa]|uniref:Uncharacterized protein n=1 Tax=Caerostris extrusa TaxID=172846 RepID=A0AAV4QB64_CAEEX|nr:hypothetical protein CEXT_191871 [Caerostris extrusa]
MVVIIYPTFKRSLRSSAVESSRIAAADIKTAFYNAWQSPAGKSAANRKGRCVEIIVATPERNRIWNLSCKGIESVTGSFFTRHTRVRGEMVRNEKWMAPGEDAWGGRALRTKMNVCRVAV